ncbi:hypothetical protein Dimus_015634, partial [Dionaea muscipula]
GHVAKLTQAGMLIKHGGSMKINHAGSIWKANHRPCGQPKAHAAALFNPCNITYITMAGSRQHGAHVSSGTSCLCGQ